MTKRGAPKPMTEGRKLTIDPEIYQRALLYVEQQIEVMRKYGSAPILTPEQYEKLVYDCAQPAQVIKNWEKRDDRE